MAGKHSRQPEKGGKTSLIIIIVAAVLILAAVGVGVFFLTQKKGEDAHTQTTVPVTSTAETVADSAAATTAATSTAQPTTAAPSEAPAETGVAYHTQPVDVVVPTQESGEITYFNATFIPNGYVEDKYTGQQTTLREVFGSSYADGAITFNSNGTFYDTLDSSGETAGAYVVQNGSIIATTTTDRNLNINVSEWNGDAPVKFSVDYGDFVVYFG